jgi:hypothetical protein
MKIYSVLLAILLMAAVSANAQFLSGQKGQVLLKGVIIDEFTDEPTGVDIRFIDPSGKKINTKSNSISGKFEQLLEAGTTYTVELTGPEVLDKEFKFDIIESENFTEQKTDWTVVKFAVGATLYNWDLFDNGSSNLNAGANSNLEKLKKMLRFNRSVYLEIILSDDSGNGGPLAQERLKALKAVVDTWRREGRKITLSVSKVSKANGAEETEVTVSKISDLFSK